MKRILWAALCLVLALLAAVPGPARAFTQSGMAVGFGEGVPMGHEWVTRLAALEVIGSDPVIAPDPDDPRKGWTKGKAKNLDISSPSSRQELNRIRSQPHSEDRYQAGFKPVYDAILGERWVDIGGFNVTKGKVVGDCWDVVAQEPVEVQYDHYMRRPDDAGGQGGLNAMKKSQERFVTYFVAAATAPAMSIVMFDGGGYSTQNEVDLNYFLFGRAAHLFQDSFSSEHTVRIHDDNYETVRQVKSYLCASGSEQHSHSQMAVLEYSSGDVVWKTGTRLSAGWSGYKPSNMKTHALVATEASKDLWAAFIRTMGLPRDQRDAAARREAETLVRHWLSGNDSEVVKWYDNHSHRGPTYVRADSDSGPGQTVSTCMKGLGYKSGTQQEALDKFAAGQRKCLFNIVAKQGYTDVFDRSMHMFYNWEWKSSVITYDPPAGWSWPNVPPVSGVPVRIYNVGRGQYMGADVVATNNLVWLKPGPPPVDFVRVGPASEAYYRVRDSPHLFLSYTLGSGQVKFYNSPTDATYAVRGAGIWNVKYRVWMWANGASPYISQKGDPNKPEGQWRIEEVP